MKPTARRIRRKPPARTPAARIVVVTEGVSTEPEYLKAFDRLHGDRSAVRLVPIPVGGVPVTVVDRAIEESKESKRDSLGDRDSVWVMFDRDEHFRFDEAKDRARKKGICLAVSDPCFELWGIYHYRDYDAPLDRHECQRELRELCSSYSRSQGKIFNDSEVIKSRYRDAVRRAEDSLARREKEGMPEGNPSTTVHRLTEHVLCVVARSKDKK